MSYRCECETADGRRGYTRCHDTAVRISAGGWLNCKRHSSVSDVTFLSDLAALRFAWRKKLGLGDRLELLEAPSDAQALLSQVSLWH